MYSQEELAQIDKPLIKRWLAALESGEWKQTKKRLVSGNGQNFCCLGVVCKLEGSGKVRRSGDESGSNSFWFKDAHSRFLSDAEEQEMYPPESIVRKLGLTGGLDANNLLVGKYASLNDEHNCSFKQIAEELRKDYTAAGLDLSA